MSSLSGIVIYSLKNVITLLKKTLKLEHNIKTEKKPALIKTEIVTARCNLISKTISYIHLKIRDIASKSTAKSVVSCFYINVLVNVLMN